MTSGKPPVYRIHPGIGIARLGDSPDEFCISPEKPAALPTACDQNGNPLLAPDGESEAVVGTFKDKSGRIKRQAARFQVYVYDEESPEGRPLQLGDAAEGGGNDGVVIDIQWRCYLANKKASWYKFDGMAGEHGYSDAHPRRNADIKGDNARQRLIIDPGAREINSTDNRKASFSRQEDSTYSVTFPPPLSPRSIDTLGEMLTDDKGRLLVLGGHGHSGSFKEGFGHPRIDTYANSDGWFDDTSDGPVMARLVLYSKRVGAIRFVDVEYPAWVLTGYPRYAPQILDMITLEDVLMDLAIRKQAYRTDLYGKPGTFKDPQRIDPGDRAALAFWQAGTLEWNPDYRPWFYRDIWPILFRVDEFTYLTNILQQSNYPHNQTGRGNFDPDKLGKPPRVNRAAAERKKLDLARRYHSGEAFVDAVEPALQTSATPDLAPDARDALLKAAAELAERVVPGGPGDDAEGYLAAWQKGAPLVEGTAFADAVHEVLDRLAGASNAGVRALRAERREDRPGQKPKHAGTKEDLARRQASAFRDGRLLRDAFDEAVESVTHDFFEKNRMYLYDLLRRPGEENVFRLGGRPNNRTFNLPLMPLLCGDNPITNELPSKFLRLTDYQLFLLRQWAQGKFINEQEEGWVKGVDPFEPYQGWVNRTGRDLDRGVLSNLLGGAFCPGGEVSWIVRNPAVYKDPFRIQADPTFYAFRLTAAQANTTSGSIGPQAYTAYIGQDLSQETNLQTGLQPGDLTKYSGIPWQADFNECTTQDIDITYDLWNVVDPTNPVDPLLAAQDKVWETLWWPAHRPLQTFELTGFDNGNPVLKYLAWARGITQTYAGDLEMVTEWSRLGFVIRNPFLSQGDIDQASPNQKYISVERTEEKKP